MATPRALLIDPDNALCYHLVSRCVRHAWLCGQDKRTRRDYSYRKSWLEQRLSHLGRCFAVDIYAQAIMSNHFHLVVYFDPLAASRWSDEEVAERWLEAFPRNTRPQGNPLDNALHRQTLLDDPNRLAKCRASLGSLSSFMQHLKQPIARRANREDAVSGHFFEQRFYSGALLSDNAVLAAMAYVDLNPVRAKIAQRIEQCLHTSIVERLKVVENHPDRLKQALAPITSGLRGDGDTLEVLPFSLEHYINYLRLLIEAQRTLGAGRYADDKRRRWIEQVASLGKRQRAYGSHEQLRIWADKRKMRRLETPIP